MNVRRLVVASAFVFASVSGAVAQEQVAPESIVSELTARPFAPEVLNAVAAEVVASTEASAPSIGDGTGNLNGKREIRKYEMAYTVAVSMDLFLTYAAETNWSYSLHERGLVLRGLNGHPLMTSLVGGLVYGGIGVAVHQFVAPKHPRIAKLILMERIAEHSNGIVQNIHNMVVYPSDSQIVLGQLTYKTTPVPAF